MFPKRFMAMSLDFAKAFPNFSEFTFFSNRFDIRVLYKKYADIRFGSLP